METTGVMRRRLTADEYQRMGEAGILHEDERVELLNGELIAMAPLGSRHIGQVIVLTGWFTPRVLGRALVSVQNSIRLSPDSEPEPDVVLLRPRDDHYRTSLPGPEDVLLLIEVADSSLRYDRDIKLPLYARAGIPEVWIVDVERRRVMVYREPSPDGYLHVTRHTRGSTLTPAAFPDLALRWDEIFG